MKNKIKFKISLKENGFHSLERGLSSFSSYEESKDEFELKEAIMFLHHGIELLFKQYLIENASESLIYSKIDSIVTKKLIKAKKQGVKVFDLPNPQHTATYLEVIDRSLAFTDNENLSEALVTWLNELNTIRNNIEHYAVDTQLAIIENLIKNLRKPMLRLFESSIAGFNATGLDTVWKKVNEDIEKHREKELEIIELLKRMQNKPIPGGVFTNQLTGHLQIPDFDEIRHNCQIGIEDNFFEVDIYARTSDHSNDWIIEVKTSDPKISDVQKLLVVSQHVQATPWLITFGQISESVRVIANRSKVYFTDKNKLQVLRESLV